MATSFQGVSLKDAVDKLLRLKDTLVCKQIDAGACRTDHDYRQRDKAQEAYDEALTAFEAAFDQELVGR